MIQVFKTNIKKDSESYVLNILSSIKEIYKIDFDFEDCDHILRIESNKDIISEVKTVLISEGIYCEEL